MTCSAGIDHAAVKRDLSQWFSLPYVGTQSAYDGRGTVLDLRNCKCGSTLCRTVRFAREVTP